MSISNGNGDFDRIELFLIEIRDMNWFQNIAEVDKQDQIIEQFRISLMGCYQDPVLAEQHIEDLQKNDWFPPARKGGTLLKDRIRTFIDDYWQWRDDQANRALARSLQEPRVLNQLQWSSSQEELLREGLRKEELLREGLRKEELLKKIEATKEFKELSADRQELVRKKAPDYAGLGWVSMLNADEQYAVVWALLQHEMFRVGLAHPTDLLRTDRLRFAR